MKWVYLARSYKVKQEKNPILFHILCRTMYRKNPFFVLHAGCKFSMDGNDCRHGEPEGEQ